MSAGSEFLHGFFALMHAGAKLLRLVHEDIANSSSNPGGMIMMIISLFDNIRWYFRTTGQDKSDPMISIYCTVDINSPTITKRNKTRQDKTGRRTKHERVREKPADSSTD